MPWPVPAPGDIASRAAGVFEYDLARVWALRNPNAAPAQVDARSNVSQLGVYARTVDLAVQDEYAFLAYVARESMIDTASDWLPRHAAIWSVPQIEASYASGNAVFSAGIAVTVPAGLALSFPGGLTYQTTTAVAIAANTTAPVPIACTVTGTQGNLAAGATLTVVNPLAGLSVQTATIDSNGVSGQDAETTEEWRARIIATKRRGNGAGSGADFQRWAGEVLPGCIVRAFTPGTGFATVAIAMPSGQTWRVPTGAELALATTYLNDAQNRKPLGVPVVDVAAANLVTQNYTVHLVPDTVATRAGATSALTLQLLADATINGTVYRSRMEAALENTSGEFADDMTVPTGDFTPSTPIDLAVIGTVTFV
ncbi:MAG TPA: baseplate J/gp47 family protein [Gammaproteobacteria bacterium]|nr:baseplate J/gp47 family protein [Gammaproteobacteria bacterium]